MPISSVTTSDTPNSGRAIWNANDTDLDTRINANVASIATVNRTPMPFFLPGVADLITSGAQIATRAGTLTQVRVVVGRAPTGASLIVSIRKNDGEVATATVTAASTTATVTGLAIPCATGDYITVAVVQLGSTYPGRNVSVSCLLDHSITPLATTVNTFTATATNDQQIQSSLPNNASTGAPGTYPPSGNIVRTTGGTTIRVSKEFRAGTSAATSGYYINNILLAFATATLPDTATIVSAKLQMVPSFESVPSPYRTIMVENFAWTGSSNTDYSSTPSGSAMLAEPMVNNELGLVWTLAMSTPLTWVNKTGDTRLRFHISGGDPLVVSGQSNQHMMDFHSSENTGGFPAPTLLVEWF